MFCLLFFFSLCFFHSTAQQGVGTLERKKVGQLLLCDGTNSQKVADQMTRWIFAKKLATRQRIVGTNNDDFRLDRSRGDDKRTNE